MSEVWCLASVIYNHAEGLTLTFSRDSCSIRELAPPCPCLKHRRTSDTASESMHSSRDNRSGQRRNSSPAIQWRCLVVRVTCGQLASEKAGWWRSCWGSQRFARSWLACSHRWSWRPPLTKPGWVSWSLGTSLSTYRHQSCMLMRICLGCGFKRGTWFPACRWGRLIYPGTNHRRAPSLFCRAASRAFWLLLWRNSRRAL